MSKLFFAKSRGFTLIELLVVIAIIGILAGIVIANLSKARGRAKAVSVRGTMKSVANYAGIYFDENGNYTNLFNISTSPDYKALEDSIKKNGVPNANIIKQASAEGFALSVEIPTTIIPSGNRFFCIDAAGSLKEYSSRPSISSSNPICP